MTSISKRDAMQLVADVRRVHIAGYSGASRSGDDHCCAMYGFVGGLEVVLRHFLLRHGHTDAAEGLVGAMTHTPTKAEVAAYDEEVAQLRNKATGSAA